MKKIITLLILSISTILSGQPTTRFMVVSDMHFYSPAPNFKESLLYEIIQAAIDEKVDFIFFTGDLVISGFSGPDEQDSVLKDWRLLLDTLSTHNIKVYSCRGNNDVNRESWDALFSGDYAFPQNGPENERNITYAVEFNDILFISLDQYLSSHRINQPWLEEVLSANEKKYIFVASHEPAFKLLHSNCMGAYPRERDAFWESLIRAGVKVFFCGHDHFYDHAIIDDGDGNVNNDVQQVMVGTGGSLHSDSYYDGDNGRWTPVRSFHEEGNGYVLVEANESNVRLIWKHRIEQHIFEAGGDTYDFFVTAVDENFNPDGYGVFQNYPNPFNTATTIGYDLPKSGYLLLVICDLLGRHVKTLLETQQQAGQFQITWDGTDEHNLPVAAGMYFCRMEAGDPSTGSGKRFVEAAKLLLIK